VPSSFTRRSAVSWERGSGCGGTEPVAESSRIARSIFTLSPSGSPRSGAATDIKNAIAKPQFEGLDSFRAQVRRQEKHAIKDRNETGQKIVASADQRAIAVNPT
jgi:hypothetical protein